MTLPRYGKYKDSGIEWLGEVPRHWEVVRLKKICNAFPSNIDKKSYDDEEPVRLCNYVDVYYNDEITDNIPFMEATASKDQIAKFALRSGDTIITKDSETADDIAISAYVPNDLPGVVCGYHLSMIRPSPQTFGRFVKRFFDGKFARAQFEVAANGLTRMGLSQYAIDNVLVPVPPLPEQTAIAAFLDRETGKIDALVAEQEKRQAVISHAVTKGLDPAAPMKDSGIQWLGEVPAHWTVVPLKYLVRQGCIITYGIVQAGLNIEGGIPYIRTMDMKASFLPEEGYLRTSPEIDAAYSRSRVYEGDIVIAIRAIVGKALPVPAFLNGANLTQGTARIAPGDDIDRDFLLYQLNSPNCEGGFERIAKGATFKEITLEMLRCFPIAVPQLQEQKAITLFLNGETAKLDALITEAQRATDLLKERRTALISAAVTGKIDVRGLVDMQEAA